MMCLLLVRAKHFSFLSSQVFLHPHQAYTVVPPAEMEAGSERASTLAKAIQLVDGRAGT